MKIELKNIKYFPSGSQETNCYTADVHINGKHIAYAHNQGHGGNTNVGYRDLKHKEVFKEAEAYCKSLPVIVHKMDGETFEIKPDLESVVDDLFEIWLEAREMEKFKKKMDKDCIRSIVCYNPNKQGQYWTMCKWNSYTIPEMLQIPSGRISVVKKVEEVLKQLKPGEEIYNPNLQDIVKQLKKTA